MSDKNNSQEFRCIKTGEVLEYLDLLANAFRGNKPTAVGRIKRGQYDDVRGLFYNRQLVSALAIRDYSCAMGGRFIPMGGIAGVVTFTDCQGRGYARTLLRATLAEMRSLGKAISILYPVSHALYRKFGWEMGARYHLHTNLSQCHFPRTPETRLVRRFHESDLPGVAGCYQQWAATYNGMVERTPKQIWGRIQDWQSKRGQIYLIENDHAIIGWFNSLTVDLAYPTYMSRTTECYLLNPTAYRAFTGFMAQLPSNIGKIELELPDNPLLWDYVAEPFEQTAMHSLFMIRIVDVKKALELRGYPKEINTSLEIELVDELAPWNGGRWRLQVASGKGTVTQSDGQADIRLDQKELAQLYIGLTSLPTLARQERLEVRNEAAYEICHQLFGNQRQYLRDQF